MQDNEIAGTIEAPNNDAVTDINELLDELAQGTHGQESTIVELRAKVNELEYALDAIKNRLIEIVLGRDENAEHDTDIDGESTSESAKELSEENSTISIN